MYEDREFACIFFIDICTTVVVYRDRIPVHTEHQYQVPGRYSTRVVSLSKFILEK